MRSTISRHAHPDFRADGERLLRKRTASDQVVAFRATTPDYIEVTDIALVRAEIISALVESLS